MRRDLEVEVVGRRIRRARVAQTRMLGRQPSEELEQRVQGRAISAVTRRGKYLFLWLAASEALLIHRGMTGNLLLRAPSDPPERHLHLALSLDDGRELWLCDHRGFGELRTVAAAEVEALDHRLGPEPLGDGFSVDYLAGQCARRSALIKALLLNQGIVAGLGNICADEALWEARVHPARRANTLVLGEVKALQGAIVRFLDASIARRGTTFSDYKDLYGQPGGNSSYLQVFHRAGQPCLRCGAPIGFIKAAGRGSSICPLCQHEVA